MPALLPFCGSFADDDWQEAHERLAELEDKPATARELEDGAVSDEMDLLGHHEENLAERLSKLVIENELEDPAIMQAVQTQPPMQVSAIFVGAGEQSMDAWNGWKDRRALSMIAHHTLFYSSQEASTPASGMDLQF